MISTENYTTVYYAMKWIEHLIDNFPTELTQLSEKIIKNLNNEDLQIVEISVILVAKIVNKLESCDLILDILNYLEETMKKDYNQAKSLSILKTLFSNIKGENLLNYFSKSLKGHTNKDFKTVMIQNLDLVINIEEDLHGLRTQLKDRSNTIFETLFEIWASDPISCISLCLISENYLLAHKIVTLMAYANMNVNMLIRLAQITKLIDMPHYACLRMQLLRPKKYHVSYPRYPHLIHTLKGMLMLLPQGKAFDSLKNRLECSSLIFDSKQADDKPVQDAIEPAKFVAMIVAESPSLFSSADKTLIMDSLS